MNVSSPFPSHIRAVDFGFLNRAEIRKLSVKRIHHTEAINRELGYPIPGGLYDQALGTRGEYNCTTCDLRFLCPGHAGHIQLAAPVYHPIFMDQLMKLLNGQCGCCLKFRLSTTELHAYACKLKLLRYGLVSEAHDIDLVHPNKEVGKEANGVDASDSSEENGTDTVENVIIRKRNKFMIKAVKEKGGKKHLLAESGHKVESLVEERRLLIKDFMQNLARNPKCNHCQGFSSKFRKDGFNKIFKLPLSQKQKTANLGLGLKQVEPILVRAKVQAEARSKKQKRHEAEDEGIAMEVDDMSEEDLDGEAEDETPQDTAVSSGDMFDSAALAGSLKQSKGSADNERQEYVAPAMILARMEELFREESEILGLLYQSRAQIALNEQISPEMFFMFDVLVTPNKYRPDMRTGGGVVTEAEQNKCYSDIITASTMCSDASRNLHQAERGSSQWQRALGSLQLSMIKLQDTVNSLIDADKNSSARGLALAPEGIKQKLEKKEGLFRMNMMGKRVNFAARSVISPDPNIETNEIGVPPVFAQKLTYPEPVTNHNFYDLKQAVINGPEKWPGATAIENENGQLVALRFKNLEERLALANQLLAPSNVNLNGARNKKVHRHLNNGDIVIMNRQPTLHKPSMMCHRARVLPGEKTIRMHYANCNTFNADFDGDEMNMHFPQNESARAEAVYIADTDHQYLSGTAGKPLRGLIQDHLSVSVGLTGKDTFLSRADYHQLLYSCLRPEKTGVNIITLPPAILKPRALWTGKQLVSTILRNIQPENFPGLTFSGKSQLPAERWIQNNSEPDKLPNEAQVICKDGELLCGILDKAQLGPAKGGFIHSVYETYGNTVAGSLLSIMGRMLTKVEHMRAFSCGMEDIYFTKAGNRDRRELLKGADQIGHEVATKYVTLDSSVARNDGLLLDRLEEVLRDDTKQQGLDTVYNSRTSTLSSNITKGCLPSGLFKDFPKNQMQTMTASGAKGSAVNANLISCNLGQQVLEGRRTPVMVSGKTLPSFKPFETAIRAGGYITNRFLTGVQPQEYYFHTMAGREGLIDTAVKTSRSGYLQRCIIKGMEGLQVQYDTTVRDSDGSVVQFLYGEDGLDVTKQVMLTNFKFQAENLGSAAQNLHLYETDPNQWQEEIADANKKAIRKYTKTNDLSITDPVMSLHNPSSTWGCTSEKFSSALAKYIKTNPERLLKDKKTNPDGLLPKKQFQMLLEMMYMRSVIEPGEPVGIVAGQSIGEPSTQMTLNTFHLAGHSAKNVTLGIPRLREIVMTATANLATPQMKVHLNDDITDEEGEKFAKGIAKRSVADIIDDVSVIESVGKGVGLSRAKLYEVRLNFFPSAEYKETYAITEEDLARAIEHSFTPHLIKLIKRELKDKSSAKSGKSKSQPVIGKSVGTSEGLASSKEGQLDEEAEKEKDRTEDALSEDSDPEDEPDEDDPDRDVDAYDDDEDDKKIAEAARQGSVEVDESGESLHEDEGYGGSSGDSTDSDADSDDDIDEKDKISGAGAITPEAAQARSDRITSKESPVAMFEWDLKADQWCKLTLEFDLSKDKILMLHLVETACRKAVVQTITNIESATIDKEKIRDDETGEEREISVVIIEGNNLVAMHDYQQVINPHQLFTNDIVAMMNIYGIEAGRATIIREMNAVFAGHNISVDHRHLNLIADHMTRNGNFLAFSRTGMKSGVSPFAKMSFETTVGFLKDAVMEKDFDDLMGPSARIVTGKVGKIGTGAFDVLTPVA